MKNIGKDILKLYGNKMSIIKYSKQNILDTISYNFYPSLIIQQNIECTEILFVLFFKPLFLLINTLQNAHKIISKMLFFFINLSIV